MNSDDSTVGRKAGRHLLRAGMLLFLVAMLTGLLLPMMANPRMGLSSHLAGSMGGILLLVFGLMWPRLRLGTLAGRIAASLAIYAAWANWLATLLAGFWGAGSTMMPLAGGNLSGTGLQEGLIGFLLASLSAAIVVTCLILLAGLRGGDA